MLVETAASHSGSRALKVFGHFSGIANESGAFQQVPSTAGDTCAASAWLLSPATDQIYLIEGTSDLHHFDQGVTEIPAGAAGMPDLDSGWSYRSFSLDDTSATEFSGFLPVGIMAAP